MGLTGCIPIVSSYSRIEVPGARYFGSSCHGVSGPSSVVYYPFQGIFISLDMNPWLRLGLHVPAGTIAQLNGETIKIEGETETGGVVFTARMKASSRGSLGAVNPKEFQAFPDPVISDNNFEPVIGNSKGGNHIWQLYLAMDNQVPNRLLQVPRGLISGTIELPSITVNGQKYESQRLQFRRERYSELSPVNC